MARPVSLVPGSIESLGSDAELHHEVFAEVFRLGLAALFLPQPDQRGFFRAHDDPGVRAAEELAAGRTIFLWLQEIHIFLRR